MLISNTKLSIIHIKTRLSQKKKERKNNKKTKKRNLLRYSNFLSFIHTNEVQSLPVTRAKLTLPFKNRDTKDPAESNELDALFDGTSMTFEGIVTVELFAFARL